MTKIYSNEIKVLDEVTWHLQTIDIPKEFLDVYKVIAFGASKHGRHTWVDPSNKSLEHVANHNSMFHHLADSYNKINNDHESDLDPLLHLACRALMAYTRKKRQI